MHKVEMYLTPLVESVIVGEVSDGVEADAGGSFSSAFKCMHEPIQYDDGARASKLSDQLDAIVTLKQRCARRDFDESMECAYKAKKAAEMAIKSRMKSVVADLLSRKSEELNLIATDRRRETQEIRSASKEASKARVWAQRVESRELKRIHNECTEKGHFEMALKVQTARDTVADRIVESTLGEAFAKLNIRLERAEKRFTRKEVEVTRKYEEMLRNVASVEQKQLFDVDTEYRSKRSQLERAYHRNLSMLHAS